MTFAEVIQVLEHTAIIQPGIHTVIPQDIYRLSAMPDACYGVFGWTPGEHRLNIMTGETGISLTLFYVDRLTEDMRNETEVQSVGIDILANILRMVIEDVRIQISGTVTFRGFRERFADMCGGVYATFTLLTVQDNICAEIYK